MKLPKLFQKNNENSKKTRVLTLQQKRAMITLIRAPKKEPNNTSDLARSPSTPETPGQITSITLRIGHKRGDEQTNHQEVCKMEQNQTNQNQDKNNRPILETNISKSKDGKYIIHRTTITDIKPVGYYSKVLEDSE